LTEVTLGIIPGTGGTQNLARACGTRRAKELILTGSPFSAEEALSWGIVNGVKPGAELLPTCMAVAIRIAANAPLAVRRAKQAIQRSPDLDLATGLAYELEAYYRLVGTQDRAEGVRAFVEKRAAVFKGC
jgi:enoyl-CoA hydratase/carnithine racemase